MLLFAEPRFECFDGGVTGFVPNTKLPLNVRFPTITLIFDKLRTKGYSRNLPPDDKPIGWRFGIKSSESRAQHSTLIITKRSLYKRQHSGSEVYDVVLSGRRRGSTKWLKTSSIGVFLYLHFGLF
jgi:hypothetical protein